MILNALVEKLKRRAKDDFKGRHFEATLILQAVSWYLRYPLSYRDIEELFLERGLEVDHSTLNRGVLAYAPLIEKRLRTFRKPHCGSIRVDETSYEDGCVKPVLFSAGRHRPVPSRVGLPGCRGGAPRGKGCPRQPRIRRDSVHATIPYSGRRSSEASGATLHQRRCQAAHVSSRPPLPRPHRTSSARRVWPDPSIRVRRCSAGPYPSYHAALGIPPSGWLQLHPLRHGPVLEVSPERDQELSRQGHDHDLAQAPARAAQAVVEPARERATGLVAQPHPGELNEGRAKAPVAVLADPLLAVRPAAAVGRSSQPGVGAKRAGVAEPAHEGLVDQHGRSLHADAPQAREVLDHLLRPPRRLALDGPVALPFQFGHLLAD